MATTKTSFFKGLLASALNAALNGAAQASNSGAGLKNVGVASGGTALVGALAYLLQHPLGQDPIVSSVVVPTIPTNKE